MSDSNRYVEEFNTIWRAIPKPSACPQPCANLGTGSSTDGTVRHEPPRVPAPGRRSRPGPILPIPESARIKPMPYQLAALEGFKRGQLGFIPGMPTGRTVPIGTLIDWRRVGKVVHYTAEITDDSVLAALKRR